MLTSEFRIWCEGKPIKQIVGGWIAFIYTDVCVMQKYKNRNIY